MHTIERLGTATTAPDAEGRRARFGVYEVLGLGHELVVAYEGEQEIIPKTHGPLITLPATVFDRLTWSAYDGCENATADRVIRYMLANYARPDGTTLTYADAHDLVLKHVGKLSEAIDFASYAHYPANKIADEEDLAFTGNDDEESDEDPRASNGYTVDERPQMS